MSDVNFTPNRGAYTELTPFRYWCQKVLPLVYDDSISYYELLCKVVNYLNITMEDVSTLNDDVTAMYTAYNELQDFVNQYFTDLNVQTQIDNKLDRMAADGTLTTLMSPIVQQVAHADVAENLPTVVEDQLPDVVEDQIDDVVGEQIDGVVADQIQGAANNWLSANITGSNALDSTLKLYDAAARSFSAGNLIDTYASYLGAENRITTFASGFWENDNGVMVHPSEPNLFYQSAAITVTAGDKYTIIAPAFTDVYNGVPRYAFTDNNYSVISASDAADQGAINKTITVPAGATKLIINDNLVEYTTDARISKMILVKGELTGTNEISNLKADLNGICAEYLNLFNPELLLIADGWKSNGVEYYGIITNLSSRYGSNTGYPIEGFEDLTSYYIGFDAKTNGEAGTTGNGLRINVLYTDGTTQSITATNSTNQFTRFFGVTNANKTIDKIYFGYGTAGNNVWYIKNIMVAKNGSDYNYLPYLIAADYYARDEVEQLKIKNTQIEESLSTINRNNIRHVQLVTPDGFGWNTHPLIGKVTTDYNGNYDIDFDVSQYDVSEQGNTYYVDSVNGAESNTGLSPASPLRKMATAYNKSDCSCIMLADGIYNNGSNLNAVTITKDLAIKAMDGAKPIIATHSGSTFTVYSGNTYSASRGSCSRVVDLQNKNSYNNPYEYAKKSTASEVVATPGSWALIEGVLYVHCVDERVPDQMLLLLIATNNIYAEGSPTVYLEGLTVMSGYSPLKVSNTVSGKTPKVYAKNCEFLYSETIINDVVMLQGTELSIFQNCKALYGMKDGFNYHAQNGTVPKAIEINCVGAMCGNAEDSNDQGSTIHDGGSAIRINSTYFRNIGSNVADEASESWNVGCVAYNPLAPNSGQRGNFYALTGTKMWLDTCRGFGNPHYNVLSATDDTTEIHLRNNIFDNADKTVSIYGTIPIYY